MRLVPWVAAAFSIFLAAVVDSALACDYCSIYTPITARELVPDSVRLGVRQDLIGYSKVRRDGDETSEAQGQNLKTEVTELSAGYDLTSFVSFFAAIPFVNNHAERLEAGGLEDTSESGLGDVALYVPLTLFQYSRGRQEFLFQFIPGVKFATGSTDRLKEDLNGMIPPTSIARGHDLTLGTGSYDVPLAAAAAWRQDMLLIEGYAAYILRTEGDFGYRYADDLRWRATVGVIALDEDNYLLTPKLAMSGIYKERDELDGIEVRDSGLNEMLLGPELAFRAMNRFDVTLSFEFPVAYDNNGIQALQDHLVRISLGARL